MQNPTKWHRGTGKRRKERVAKGTEYSGRPILGGAMMPANSIQNQPTVLAESAVREAILVGPNLSPSHRASVPEPQQEYLGR